jgi:hypothetical protein
LILPARHHVVALDAEGVSNDPGRLVRVAAFSGPARGILCGDKPFGFDVKDGELVPLPREQAAIRRMVKLRAEGTSLREIAAAMERDGFEISHMGVDKIVKAAAAGERRRRCHDRL